MKKLAETIQEKKKCKHCLCWNGAAWLVGTKAKCCWCGKINEDWKKEIKNCKDKFCMNLTHYHYE